MQEVTILYKNGSLDTFSIPSLSADNGAAYAIDNVYLDLSCVESYGLCLMRNAITFDKPHKLGTLLKTDQEEPADRVVIVDKNALRHVLMVLIDGVIMLIRGRIEDGAFLYYYDSDYLVIYHLFQRYGQERIINTNL